MRPTVVRNMPEASTFTVAGGKGPGVRGRLGLGPDATILVYPGAVTPICGLDTAVRAWPQLPDTHLVLMVASRGGYVAELVKLAAELGVAERLHVLDYVPVEGADRLHRLRHDRHRHPAPHPHAGADDHHQVLVLHRRPAAGRGQRRQGRGRADARTR